MAPPRRLVVVTAFAVHPPRRGGQTRLDGLLRNLGAHWQIAHWSQCIQRTDLPWPRAVHEVTQRWTEHRMRDPVSLLWMLAVTKYGYPEVYSDRTLALLPRRDLRNALQSADAVLVSHPYQVAWVRAHTPASTPLVMDSPNVESRLYPPRGSWASRRLASAVQRSEARAWGMVDLAFASSDGDADALRGGGVADVVVVPNAVDVESRRPADAEARRMARRRLGIASDASLAFFMGSAHPPNIEAVELLEQQAASYATAGVTVAIVGRCSIGRTARAGLLFAGEVDDVALWLAAADIAVCPLLRGGGTSLKMLEFLAAGLPIVATPAGARGLDLVAGRDAVICDPAAVAREVAALVADSARRDSIGAAARRVAEERFSWTAAAARATQALDRLVAR